MKLFVRKVAETGRLLAVFSGINFKTAAEHVLLLNTVRRCLVNRVTVVSDNVNTVSNGASISLAERGIGTATAALSTTLTGANNDIVLTSRTAGAIGNSTSLTLLNTGVPQQPLTVAVVGQAIAVSLALDNGTSQVETATAAGTVTEPGDIAVVVTAAGMTGSPITLAVAADDNDTAATWAAKVRTALNANANITALFIVGGVSTAISLTRRVAAANDGTLNIALADGTSTGVTTAASSANTTAGVAPAITTTATQLLAAIAASPTANALVSGALKGADTGAGIVTALALSALTGGTDYTAVQSVVDAVDLADTDAANKKQTLTDATTLAIQPGSSIALTIATGSTATADEKTVVLDLQEVD